MIASMIASKLASKFILLALIGAMTQLNAAVLSLQEMSDAELKACGIEKLSPEEKHALDAWLAKQAPAHIAPIVHKNKITHGEFAIKATQDLGRYVTLENGQTFEITSRSRKKTMAWKAGDKVRLIEPVRPVSYKLENRTQKQLVTGKQADAPPPAIEIQPEVKAEPKPE